MNSIDRDIMASAIQANRNTNDRPVVTARVVDPVEIDFDAVSTEDDDTESVSASTPLLEHSFINDGAGQEQTPLNSKAEPQRTIALHFTGPPLPSYDEATATFQIAIHAVYIDLSRRRTINPYGMIAVHDFHLTLGPTTTFKEFGRKWAREILNRKSPATFKKNEQFCMHVRLEYVETKKRLGILTTKKKRSMVVNKNSWTDVLEKLRSRNEGERKLSVEYRVAKRVPKM